MPWSFQSYPKITTVERREHFRDSRSRAIRFPFTIVPHSKRLSRNFQTREGFLFIVSYGPLLRERLRSICSSSWKTSFETVISQIRYGAPRHSPLWRPNTVANKSSEKNGKKQCKTVARVPCSNCNVKKLGCIQELQWHIQFLLTIQNCERINGNNKSNNSPSIAVIEIVKK